LCSTWQAYGTCTSCLDGRGCKMTSGFLLDLIRSFLVGLAGRTSTVSSPSQVPVPSAYRGVPMIDPEKCILCGRCGKVCPAGAIALRTSSSEKSVRIFVGHCVFCSECAMICPVSAITMSDVWNTAVTDRLSRDTMSERAIKRRPKSSKAQKPKVATSDDAESGFAADPTTAQAVSADSKDDATSE
jgi:formate hydrogenlyase subunit 6/NADH:ubiquinone oxidoreductase subunit I